MTAPTNTDSSSTIASPSAVGDVIETSASDQRLYKNVVLDNELQCLLISDPTTDKASAAMDVRVGHLLDPIPGLAHFLEHMLFLGTTKYPNENEYSSYLNQNGGSSNAFTDMECTNFYFDVAADKLEGALDRFAQFFISPLMDPSCLERERQAVDSENAKNLQSDMWRSFQLVKSLARPDHPFCKFGTGNASTLNVEGIRDLILQFYRQHYSANLCKLVVLGSQSLEELQELVSTYFADMVNKSLAIPTFPGKPFDCLPKVVEMVPIKEHRSVELSWMLPEVDSLYLSKPTRYLSHLLGHESGGSILSLLKYKKWAHELSAGESRSCSDWSSFSVSIELTEEGEAHYEQVVEVVFAYLTLLRQEGPQEWIHDETATVADCSFRFLSKRNPMDYTSSLATRMQTYPQHHVLSGPYKIYEYEPAKITEMLEYFSVDNMLLQLSSKSFEGKTDLQEKWYGTNYSLQDISPELKQSWQNASPKTDWMEGRLSLPERNDMIATDFALVSDANLPKDEPVLLRDDELVRLWYKPDNVFDMPKVNIMVHFQTRETNASPDASALGSLWIQILMEHTNEFAYLASMAGLHVDVIPTRTGMELHLSGFSHKVQKLLERVVKTMVSNADQTSEELFTRIQQKLIREYQNYFFGQPYHHAFYALDQMLEHGKWSMEEKLDAMQHVTLQRFKEYSSRLLERFHLELLVHGNLSPTQATSVADIMLNGLQPMPPFRSNLPQQRVVQLQHDAVYRFEEYNSENTNSCLAVLYQMGPMDLKTNATLALVHHLVREPAYNVLRTQEQLGYIVHTAVHTNGANIKGMLVLIQSDGFDPIHLNERVDAFVDFYRTEIASMSQEEFQSHVDAVVKTFLEKNKNLGEESTRYWNVIMNRTYIFQRYQKIAAEVKQLDKGSVLRFFDRFVASKGKRLSVQVFSNNHAERIKEDASDTLVKDVVEFKRQLPLFPLADTVDVEHMKMTQKDEN